MTVMTKTYECSLNRIHKLPFLFLLKTKRHQNKYLPRFVFECTRKKKLRKLQIRNNEKTWSYRNVIPRGEANNNIYATSQNPSIHKVHELEKK